MADAIDHLRMKAILKFSLTIDFAEQCSDAQVTIMCLLTAARRCQQPV